jgi:hypothetical protein
VPHPKYNGNYGPQSSNSWLGKCVSRVGYKWYGATLNSQNDKVIVNRTADATRAQLADIKAGERKQPNASTYKEELASGKTTLCWANRRDGGEEDSKPRYDILCKHSCTIEGLDRLLWMRANK